MKRFVMLGIFTFVLGCSQQAQPKPGDLCAVDEKGSYRIAKVLVVDEVGVHVRLYKSKWKERPQQVDSSTPSLGGIDDKDGFGMGHVPLTKRAFAAMKPVVIGHEEVRKEELDGYHMWKDGRGGYFGNK